MLLVLLGGRVLDPANDVDGVGDVYIDTATGTIREIRLFGGGDDAPALAARARAAQRYDCVGKIVVPGLIDIHTHLYRHATPLGVPVDEYCLRRGVTTPSLGLLPEKETGRFGVLGTDAVRQ